MANNINARIYKNYYAAAKYAKKVNGKIVKDCKPVIKNHGQHSITLDEIKYIVYHGKYKGVC